MKRILFIIGLTSFLLLMTGCGKTYVGTVTATEQNSWTNSYITIETDNGNSVKLKCNDNRVETYQVGSKVVFQYSLNDGSLTYIRLYEE